MLKNKTLAFNWLFGFLCCENVAAVTFPKLLTTKYISKIVGPFTLLSESLRRKGKEKPHVGKDDSLR